MKITEEWLKKQGWEVSHYDIPELNHNFFHYATKMFGSNKVFYNDKHQLKIFRDYETESDVYADVLIDNVDTVEKLEKALILCDVCTFKECTDLYRRLRDNSNKIKFDENIWNSLKERK